MKYMAAVLALAAVTVAAPVEVENRDNTCPNTATVACCFTPVLPGINSLCSTLQLGRLCPGYSYCCNNEAAGRFIKVNLLTCDLILETPAL